MYSFTTVSDYDDTQSTIIEKQVLKGIQRAARNKIRHQDYLNQLQLPAENRVTVRRFATKLHNIYTLKNNKRALCAFDDKRLFLEDGIHTLAYGNYKINQVVEDVETEGVGDIVLSAVEARITLNPIVPAGVDPQAHAADFRADCAAIRSTRNRNTK